MTHERESDQLRQRRENLEALEALGVSTYPHRFPITDTVSALVDANGGTETAALDEQQVQTVTAGRVLAIRSFGKANFLVVADGKTRIQVYVRKDALSERDFATFKLLDLGDFVGTEGRVFRTRTNELTVWATKLEFLAKCLVPLPEK